MFCTIINDCKDANAAGRQTTRAAALFGCPVNFIGVDFGGDLQAAGNLVDILDAGEGPSTSSGQARGVVLVNVAPRNGSGKKWPNGTPFGYFWHKETLVVSSVDGLTLSLAKKLGILKDFHVLETPAEYAKHQFRSFAFLPKAAKTLLEGGKLKEHDGGQTSVTIPEAPKAVWWVDNFGNCKTTLLPEEIGFESGKQIKTKFGEFMCFESLKDVPDGQFGLVIGSSGLGDKRFLELVKQGESAAKYLGILSGAVL